MLINTLKHTRGYCNMAVKWACLGPGNMSRDFFLSIQDNLSTQDHEFVAVASHDLSRAQTFAEKFKFKRAYGSWDDVANDKEVDVAYIATKTSSHVELSIKMMEAGKHVLCEAPMAINLKEAKRVFEVAKRNKRIFMENMWWKLMPGYYQIQKELAANTLGDIRLVQVNVCAKYETSAAQGGGGMLDNGVFGLSLACAIFNEMPEQIKAVAQMTESKDKDLGGCVILQYKNGGMASVTYHEDTDVGSTSACIMGTKGNIEIAEQFFAPLKISTPTGTYEYSLKTLNNKIGTIAGLHYMAKTFQETIANGKLENDNHTMAHIEMVLSIADEVRKQIGLVYPGFD